MGTELEEVDGVLTGRFRTPNCRGPEKLARLAGILETAATLYAYGNSGGDADLLARADVACHVKRDRLPSIAGAVTDPTA